MKRRRDFSIILVGERGLLREGIERILRSANFRIRASVAPGDDLISSQVGADQLLFVMVQAGDDFDVTIEQIEFLRNHHPGARVAIVDTHYRLDDVVAAFRAGANGYFADVTSCEVFAKSVELVMLGELVFPPAFLSFPLVDDHHVSNRAPTVGSSRTVLATGTIDPRLSPRERSILRCLIEGDSNKCIARKIEIAEATVKVHIKAILRKIQVQNRTQAAIWGVNHPFLAEAPETALVPSNAVANGELPVPCNGGERQFRVEGK
ncbi:response regulator transcription factor [Bradyrhizobium sp. CB3481]|uniref:LuxR C-terminal-related transcriptional regulator n=1 Tax=Bradyrhizobium sp. CB3481 TaxID=3039158 RepID=UPI0024B26470|nr:response regulator transcription factor [Bradyrhizobium sp. CB3481]WFU18456.1 response regulator transcription factor [Bradyrhizobium sp. CB3481]